MKCQVRSIGRGAGPRTSGSCSARTIACRAGDEYSLTRRQELMLAVAAFQTVNTPPACSVMPDIDAGPQGFKVSELIPTEDVNRVVEAVKALPSTLERYSYLSELRASKPGLFFAALQQRPVELLPVVYTPGVGEACRYWGLLTNRPRALVLSPSQRGQLAQMIRAWSPNDMQAVVVTDGQRILGLGDLGANGAGISVGKALLYTVAGGIHPNAVLPVVLDVGCDDQAFRDSAAYVGRPEPRLSGAAYDDFIEEFYTACQAVHGKDVLVHWEDFGSSNAATLLQRYRSRGPTFNDDIQSTAAVALACVLGACRRGSVPPLAEQVFMFAGAGQAALGIAAMLTTALVDEGLTEEEARSRMWLFDRGGLIAEGRDDLASDKAAFAQTTAAVKRVRLRAGASLADGVAAITPTCLVGAAAKGGLFTPAILSSMAAGMPAVRMGDAAANGGRGAQGAPRCTPIVLSLSNPTDRAECSFQDAWDATGGNVAFASGSPFPAIETEDGYVEAVQANNALVFPGLGAGAVLSGATAIPQSIFLAAATALADEATPAEAQAGLLIPPVARIRDAAVAVATQVCIECSITMVSAGSGKTWKLVQSVLAAERDAASMRSNGTDGPAQSGQVTKARLQLRNAIDDWRF
eukprot:jgi/Ulvmu1/7906/UM004_0138.1